MPEQAYKWCPRCEREKPFEDFSAKRDNADGKQSQCKVCRRLMERQRVQKDPEAKLAAVRRWKEQNPDLQGEYTKRSRGRYPEKQRARDALSNAVRRGKLTKPEHCDECREPTQRGHLDAHHADYSKPLEVRWLCKTCHASHHLREREEAESKVRIERTV